MFSFESTHPMIYVFDMDRAVNFYTEILGLSLAFRHENNFASVLSVENNTRIDMHPTTRDMDVKGGMEFYFNTKRLDRMVEYLKSKEVKVSEIRSEGDTRFAHFWDSEGNHLGLAEVFNA